MNVSMLWKAWYGDEVVTLGFPDGWDVREVRMADAPSLGSDGIERAFDEPIGCPSIEEIVSGCRTVAIAIEDITRPTRTEQLLRPLLQRLNNAGIRDENIVLISALGAHRPMTRPEFVAKYGKDTVERILTYNHYPFDNLVYAGETRTGPAMVNRFFFEADAKIGVGTVFPHGHSGFSGGAKIVLPGVAGIDTICANHRGVSRGSGDKTGGIGIVEGNATRLGMEEFARQIGLSFIVNAVVNSAREIAGVFVGDVVDAHREAVKLARRTYATRLPDRLVDVAILNAYPKDTELIQSPNAFNAFGEKGESRVLNEGGTAVVMTASSEGRGLHYLYDRGMKLYTPAYEFPSHRELFRNYGTIVYSPNLSEADLWEIYPKQTKLARQWDDVIRLLEDRYECPSVAVFPFATMQFPVEA